MTVPDQSDWCWPVDPACLADDWDSLETDVQDRSLAMAQATLYRLTLGRVGGCPITVRPCRQNCAQGLPLGYEYDYWASGWMYPFMRPDGSIFNCCGSTTGCGCQFACSVTPGGFVGKLSEVKIDGVAATLSDFKVADHEEIVYQGTSTCPFPTTQDLNKPDTEVGTFSITYLPAFSVDGQGAYAMGLLALEFSKACQNKTCALPTNVTSMVRQGVSYNIIPGVFPQQRTGIFNVDAFIARYNPSALMQPPSVIVPGRPGVRTFTS